MTKDEAIRILEQSCPKRPQKLWSIKRKEAVNMAIEALTVQPKRKPVIRCWCPKCGFEMIPTIDSDMKGDD